MPGQTTRTAPERIERAAKAIFRGFFYLEKIGNEGDFDCLWNQFENRHKRYEALYHARAALTADAPEIAAAEIRGLETAREIAHIAGFTVFGSAESSSAKRVRVAISARIAELKAKSEPTK